MNTPGQGQSAEEPRTCFEILRDTADEAWSDPVYDECEITDATFDRNEIEPDVGDCDVCVMEIEYDEYCRKRDEREAEEEQRYRVIAEAMGEPMPKGYFKKAICTKLRWRVFKRDKYRCQHCFAEEDLTADHIIPESLGGPTIIENLQTLCRPCNSKKGAR